MHIIIIDEAQVWNIWDNMKYFDRNTFEELGPFPGYMACVAGSYGDEGGFIQHMRNIRELLIKHDGDIEGAKRDIEGYGVLDQLEDLFMKRPSRMPYVDVRDFEFWLKIYQRRNLSVADR